MKKPETVYEKLSFAMSYIKFLKKEIANLEQTLEDTRNGLIFESTSIDNYYKEMAKVLSDLRRKIENQKMTLDRHKVAFSKYKQYLPWIKRLQEEGLIEPELTTEI